MPIGLPLNETVLFLKQADKENLINLNELFNDDSLSTDFYAEGELLHSSETRKCYINGKRSNFIESGDFVVFKNKRVYVKGRTNRLVKINGKMVNLILLENVKRNSPILTASNFVFNTYPGF